MTTYLCPEGHTSQADDWCDVCGAQITVGDPGATAAPPPPPLVPPASKAPDAAGSSAPKSSLDLDAPSPTTSVKECPNCGNADASDALFCENCGYDFTTGQLPEPSAPLGAPPLDPSSVVAPPANGNGNGNDMATDPSAGATEGAPAAPAPEAPQWVAEVWVDPDWYASQDSEDTDPCPSSGPPRVVHLPGPSALIGRVSKSRNIHPAIDCGNDTSVSRRHAELTLDGGRWFLEDLQSTNGTFRSPSTGPMPIDPIEPGIRVELADNDRVYVGAWTRIVVRPATAQERQ